MTTTIRDSIPGGQTCPSPLTWNFNEQHSSTILLVLIGIAFGILITLLFVYIFDMYRQQTTTTSSSNSSLSSLAMAYAQDCRRRLPDTIILIRHGESEANADKSLYTRMPDNLLGLTNQGREQAAQAGQRVQQILQQQQQQQQQDDDDDNCTPLRVHLVVSPFERSLQTAAALRPAFEHCIVRTDIESRIREQEMGNLQNDAELFRHYRKEQERVGRFWYRFPTGESGSDVLDRVKSWWYESVQTVNTRVGYEPVQAMVVVSHGLTIRFILMQLFGWSPTTFHSVWNAGNCQMYVLKKDLSKPGPSPYVLDKEQGDVPQSSINLRVQLQNKQQESSGGVGGAAGETTTTTTKSLILKDYLNVPPPRTTQLGCIKYMLAEQYPEEIKDPNDIASIMFMPFVAGGIIKGRSSSGVEKCNKTSTSSSSWATTAASSLPSLVVSSTISNNGDVSSSSSANETPPSSKVQWAAKQEQSRRWSYFRVPDERSPNKS